MERSFGKRRRAAAALAMLMASTATGRAMAQDAAASAGGSQSAPAAPAPPAGQPAAQSSPDDIVVTAQFREQNVQQTPLAITAVSGALLAARSQTNIVAVANQAPNLTLKPQGAGFGPSLAASIRGIGQYDFNPALEPGVGVYVDDVYYATITGSIFDLLDLDRVEILRGPQGTLAGKNSIGGAVKLYSKKPNGEDGGYLSATYGSRNRVDLRGSADVKIADNLFGRLAVVEKRQDGYVDRLDYGCVNPNGGIPATRSATQGCRIDRESEVNYQGLRGMLRWQPDDRLEVNLIGDYTHEDRTVAGSVLLLANQVSPNVSQYPGVTYDSRFVCGKYCNYATFNNPGTTFLIGVVPVPVTATQQTPRLTYNGYGFSGTIDYKLADNLSLKSITAYRNYSTDFSNDDDLSPLQVTLGTAHLTFHSVSEELRLNGSFADKAIEYTLGGFYLSNRSVYANYQDFRTIPVPFQFQANDPVDAHTAAVFAQASWHATDKLTLNGGLRYTDEAKTYGFSRRNKDGSPNLFVGALDGLSGRYSGDHVDYRANVQYQWTPSIMTYFETSTGIKGGGINPRPFVAAQVQPFGPEKLTSYEVGAKTDLFDRLLRLNLAAFYGDYKDIQLTLFSCPQFGGPGPRAARQRRRRPHQGLRAGIDAAADHRPVVRRRAQLSRLRLHAHQSRRRRARRRADRHGHALFAQVEMERGRPVRGESRRYRDADPARRRLVPEPHLRQFGQCVDQPHPGLHAVQCAADLPQSQEGLGGRAGGDQLHRQILFPHRLRCLQHQRRGQRSAGSSPRMGAVGQEVVLTGAASLTAPGPMRDRLAFRVAREEEPAAWGAVSCGRDNDEASVKRQRNETAISDIDRGFLPAMIGYHIGRVRTAMWRHRLDGQSNLMRSGQFTALALIAFNPGVSQQQVADELLLDKATVVGVIDRLEKDGLVERQHPKHDRRRYALHATPLGHEQLAQTHRMLIDHEEKLRAQFSPAELTTLFGYLERIVVGSAPDEPDGVPAKPASGPARSRRPARLRSAAASDTA